MRKGKRKKIVLLEINEYAKRENFEVSRDCGAKL